MSNWKKNWIIKSVLFLLKNLPILDYVEMSLIFLNKKAKKSKNKLDDALMEKIMKLFYEFRNNSKNPKSEKKLVNDAYSEF